LREFMKHGFERICILYERVGAKVCFSYLHNNVYSTIYIYKCRYNYYNLFLCL